MTTPHSPPIRPVSPRARGSRAISGSPRLSTLLAAFAVAVCNLLTLALLRSASGTLTGTQAIILLSATDLPIVAALWATLIRPLQEQYRRISSSQMLLHQIDRHILAGEDLDRITPVCQGMADLYGCSLVWIGMKEPDGTVSVQAAGGKHTAYLDGISIRWDDTPEGRGPIGTAIRTGQPQVEYVTPFGPFAPWYRRAVAHGIKESISIPLAARQGVLGVLSLYSAVPNTFDSPELQEHLLAFADQMAISLQAARHQREIHVLNTALESADNAVVITDQDGQVLWANPAFTRLTGYTLEEVRGEVLPVLRSGLQSPESYEQIWKTITSGQVWHGETSNRRKDGTTYVDEQTITPVRGATGEITHFISIQQDVTERRRQEEWVRHLAMHDPLTDLPNRRSLYEHLTQLQARSRRGRPAALLFLDLDDFKLVNDSLGHLVGDEVLAELARVLGGTMRSGDLFARLGGDEFAVLLHDTYPEEARAVAARLQHQVNDFRFHHSGQTFSFGVSIGVAPIRGRFDPETVLALADTALHEAKEQGKNRIVSYENPRASTGQMMETSRWVMRIKDALAEGRFEVCFQPVVRLADEKPIFLEALIRMRDHAGDLVVPGVFLPAAERFGLMPDLDRWMVGTVLDWLERSPDLQVLVNLSGTSLADNDLLSDLEEKIRTRGNCATRLAFEITETAAVKDLGRVQRWMRRLKELGCRFALDDFGTGFSSFSYLQAIPADFVKIDGSFIQNLDSDPANRALVQAITTAAHALGKAVIAEWVESATVARILTEMGVEYGQGYHWGRPAPAEEA